MRPRKASCFETSSFEARVPQFHHVVKVATLSANSMEPQQRLMKITVNIEVWWGSMSVCGVQADRIIRKEGAY